MRIVKLVSSVLIVSLAGCSSDVLPTEPAELQNLEAAQEIDLCVGCLPSFNFAAPSGSGSSPGWPIDPLDVTPWIIGDRRFASFGIVFPGMCGGYTSAALLC